MGIGYAYVLLWAYVQWVHANCQVPVAHPVNRIGWYNDAAHGWTPYETHPLVFSGILECRDGWIRDDKTLEPIQPMEKTAVVEPYRPIIPVPPPEPEPSCIRKVENYPGVITFDHSQCRRRQK